MFCFTLPEWAVALERDGLLAAAADPNMMVSLVYTGDAHSPAKIIRQVTRVPKENEIFPQIVYKDKPLVPGVKAPTTDVPCLPTRLRATCRFRVHPG